MTQIAAPAIETDLHGIRRATCPSCQQTGRMTYAGAQEDEDGTFLCDLWNCTACGSTVVLPPLAAEPPAGKPTLEDLYKMACWKHAAAQDPWAWDSVNYWQGAAHALAWALRAKGLTDRQLNQMEEDGIAVGRMGRWDGLLAEVGRPDASAAARRED